MKTALAIAAGIACGGASACVSAAGNQGLTPIEATTACQVSRGLSLGGTGAGWNTDPLSLPRREQLRSRVSWKQLPETMRCDLADRRFRASDYGDFIRRIGFSRDGHLVALEGGWQDAPEAGGGGECYFERVGTEWRRIDCFHTWDSIPLEPRRRLQ